MSVGVRAHFTRQAAACRDLGSPFTAALLEGLAVALDPADAVGARVLSWPGDPAPDALALRVAGALHALVLDGAAPALAALYPPAPTPAPEALSAAAAAVFRDRRAEALAFLESPPQTNEVGRAAPLFLGLSAAAAARGPRLALFEIGASAGLNLHLDAYEHRIGPWIWSPPQAALALEPEIRGAPPPEPAPFEIVERAACDQAPIDPGDPSARRRLKAYVWPDQTERAARLAAALDHAAASPVRVTAADAAPWVAERMAARPAGAVAVLAHSIMWQYLPDATQIAIEETMARVGAEATPLSPLAWLRLEDFGAPRAAVLRLTLWPGGGAAAQTRDLALADYHGRWIRWTPDA